MRAQYKKHLAGDKSSWLNKERIAMLEDAKFEWKAIIGNEMGKGQGGDEEDEEGDEEGDGKGDGKGKGKKEEEEEE